MITREQVADLREDDVVELRDARMPDALLRGRVEEIEPGVLGFGIPTLTILRRGELIGNEYHSLTVVSRAPRPLYVNHPRTEPAAGDVVAPPDDDDDDDLIGWRPTWARSVEGTWIGTHTGRPIAGEMLDRLRLLVDGETGQVVP